MPSPSSTPRPVEKEDIDLSPDELLAREKKRQLLETASTIVGPEQSVFKEADPVLPDAIMKASALFEASPHIDKLNLGIGVCANENGKLEIPGVVRKAFETATVQAETFSGKYLSNWGNPAFLKAVQLMTFGDTKNVTSVQTIGGTNALFIIGMHLKYGEVKGKPAFQGTMYVPSPTWGNHVNIFSQTGLPVSSYPYLSPNGKSVDEEAMAKFVKTVKAPAAILMHASCPNPAAIEMTPEFWVKVLSTIAHRQKAGEKIVLVFDSAYQGFSEGLEADAFPIRLAKKMGIEFYVAESCSKKFGLYGNRTGSAHFHTLNTDTLEAVSSFLALKAVRANISSASRQGAAVVAEVLGSEASKAELEHFLSGKRKHFAWTKAEISEHLQTDARYIAKMRGMFILVHGIDAAGAEKLWNDDRIMTIPTSWKDANGGHQEAVRVCLDALNADNIHRGIRCFNSLMR